MTARSDKRGGHKLTLFDLDHTLLSGDSDVLWCDFLMDEGILARDVFAPQNADMDSRYRAGIVGLNEFANFYVGTLAGKTLKEWEPLRQHFLRTHIVPRIPASAIKLVNQHVDAGDLVILTTATNRFITELTAIYLGIEHLIATEPEIIQGSFTGCCVGDLNMREGKVLRLQGWLTAAGHKLKHFESTAYSDSINDLPLLSAVDHAIAVDPDAKLRVEAVSRGWDIVSLAR